MNLFLTSNIGGIKKVNGERIATKFFEENEFLKNLKAHIKNYNKFVLVASNPDNYELNDKFLQLDIKALSLSNMKFKEYIFLDNRNKDNIKDIINNSSLIILSGGDTYQQNIFFNEINLKQYLKNIDACIVGISAGTINCAKTVFNSHEEEIDLDKPNILNGLNLTNINIEPHFDINSTNKLQMSEILKESYSRIIYGLPDGTYILNNIIYGKCYKIKDGNIILISNDNEKYIIEK